MRRTYPALAALLLIGIVSCDDPMERTLGHRDEQITAEVEASLRTNVPGTIDVNTRDRVVTLSGTVPDAAARERAAQIAARASGVARVNNNLRATIAGDEPAGAPPNRPPARELQ